MVDARRVDHRMPGEHEQIRGPACPGHMLLAALDPAALALADVERAACRPALQAGTPGPGLPCGGRLDLEPGAVLVLQVPPGSVGAESCPSPPSATELLVGARVGTVRLGPVGGGSAARVGSPRPRLASEALPPLLPYQVDGATGPEAHRKRAGDQFGMSVDRPRAPPCRCSPSRLPQALVRGIALRLLLPGWRWSISDDHRHT
jgi:hypothetical protein